MIPAVPPLMTDIEAHARRHWRLSSAWWEREAHLAILNHRARVIVGRNDQDLYLLRCWLHEPKLGGDQGLESGGSAMLHYFARGDDDAALHDHPWDFRTTLLNGWYDEHLPPLAWDPRTALGPAWNDRIERRVAGDTMDHAATDLHCVGAIAPGTWTLVRTGHRVRPWGFFPPGQPWQPWRDYIAAKRAA